MTKARHAFPLDAWLWLDNVWRAKIVQQMNGAQYKVWVAGHHSALVVDEARLSTSRVRQEAV